MRLKTVISSIVVAATSVACADHVTDLGAALSPTDSRGAGASSPAMLAESCDAKRAERSSQMVGCVIDSSGQSFLVDGELPVLPTQPPYGVLVRLHGAAITEPDLEAGQADRTQPNVRVRAYAAPYHIEDCRGLPEFSEANRLAAYARPTHDGGVRALIREPLPSGTQVYIAVDFASPWLEAIDVPTASPNEATCDPSQGCDGFGQVAFGARFYVGEVPPLTRPRREPLPDSKDDGCSGS